MDRTQGAEPKVTDQNPNSASDPGKLHESAGLFSRFKDHAKAAAHATLGLVHKGIDAEEHLRHSPGMHRATETATKIGKDVAHDEIEHVHGAIDAGKKGDVRGVIRNGLPVAAEAALGPEVVLLNKAKHEAERHGADELLKHSPDQKQAHHAQKHLPHLEINHDESKK